MLTQLNLPLLAAISIIILVGCARVAPVPSVDAGTNQAVTDEALDELVEENIDEAVDNLVDEIPIVSDILDDEEIRREALIKDVDTLVPDTDTTDVIVLVEGNYRDSCSAIDEAVIERKHDLFEVTLTTRRDEEAMCAQIMVPFEDELTLDTSGLPSGQYVVAVNGVKDTFTLP